MIFRLNTQINKKVLTICNDESVCANNAFCKGDDDGNCGTTDNPGATRSDDYVTKMK